MKKFIDFLNGIVRPKLEDKGNSPSVTIALIDNGVKFENSPGVEETLGIPNLADGISYYGQRDEENIQFRDFFTGPSRHGTQMATCINKVCPMVELYVARMDDSMPEADKFTVDSATKVITVRFHGG
jgi:hypothetical protein